MAAHTLDVRGVSCPMPIVRTSQAMKGLAPGDTLELLEHSEDAGVFRFVLRKAVGRVA